jgi:hypothetical protein
MGAIVSAIMLVLVILILATSANSSDKMSALTVIFMLSMFGMVIEMLNKIDDVKANWNTYKCNPAIVPFAPIFGKNPLTVFTECVQTMQSNNIGVLLAPLNYNVSMLSGLGSELSGSISALQAGAVLTAGAFTGVADDFKNKFNGGATEMRRFVLNLRDTFGKVGGIVYTLLKASEASVITGKSMVKACFAPDTMVCVNGGNQVRIADVSLGDVMDGTDAVVLATMRIANTNDDGSQRETMYCIDGAVVSGSHLIFDTSVDGYVDVDAYVLSQDKTRTRCRRYNEPVPELVCLITSNHTIPIGPNVFHDWEDNQGSPSKSIGDGDGKITN